MKVLVSNHCTIERCEPIYTWWGLVGPSGLGRHDLEGAVPPLKGMNGFALPHAPSMACCLGIGLKAKLHLVCNPHNQKPKEPILILSRSSPGRCYSDRINRPHLPTYLLSTVSLFAHRSTPLFTYLYNYHPSTCLHCSATHLFLPSHHSFIYPTTVPLSAAGCRGACWSP